MIIACDLDRTLLPNGSEPDDGALERLYETINDTDHTLVYVTGRSLDMVREAYDTFGLRVPDYLLASVGTEVFYNHERELTPDPNWKTHVYDTHPDWDRDEIVSSLAQFESLTPQEEEVQNEFKISYYAEINSFNETQQRLAEILKDREHIEVIYSIDPIKEVGLIDILPKTATKLGALEYVRTTLNEHMNDVIYAGDSGNDILPLTFGYRSIVVKNASDAVKEEVLRIATEKDILEKTYIATGTLSGESGIYASGVIEGLKYFLSK